MNWTGGNRKKVLTKFNQLRTQFIVKNSESNIDPHILNPDGHHDGLGVGLDIQNLQRPIPLLFLPSDINDSEDKSKSNMNSKSEAVIKNIQEPDIKKKPQVEYSESQLSIHEFPFDNLDTKETTSINVDKELITETLIKLRTIINDLQGHLNTIETYLNKSSSN